MSGLDISKLEGRKLKIISSVESIKCEEVIAWSDDVIEGRKTVRIGEFE